MQALANICIKIIAICCPCLQSSTSHHNEETNNISECLLPIEMDNIHREYEVESVEAISINKEPEYNSPKTSTKLKLNKKTISNFSKENEPKNTREVNGEFQSERNSAESFYTMNSGSSRPVSRRTFKLYSKKPSSSEEEEFKSIRIGLDSNSETDLKELGYSVNNLGVQEFLYEQFEVVEYSSNRREYMMDMLTQSRLKNHNMFQLLVHKLEDYNTFYDESSALVFRKGNNFIGSMVRSNSEFQFNNKMSKYMSLCRIYGDTTNSKTFLKWFTTAEVQSKLHNFNQINILHCNDKLDYPVLRTQQYNNELNFKKVYYLIKQIELAEFEGQQVPTMLQVDWHSGTQEGVFFERILRMEVEEQGMIEIYTESSEDIKYDPNLYFQHCWESFYDKIIKDEILLGVWHRQHHNA